MAMPKPTIKAAFHRHGFGFDPRNNDYKVVRIVNFYPTMEAPTTHIEVYYAASWKMSSTGRNSYPVEITTGRFASYLEGAVHFAAIMWNSNDPLILSFDLFDEAKTTRDWVPSSYDPLNHQIKNLGIHATGYHFVVDTYEENLVLLNKPNDAFSRRRVSRKRKDR
ncbi:hypothetical protein ACSBR1_042128 [Camellia fascicularis]